MKFSNRLILLVLVACAAGATAGSAESPRIVQSLDRDWHFHLGAEPEAIKPGYDDSAWPRVDVPHDYVVEGAFAQTNPFPRAASSRDDGWYSLHGFLPVQPAVYRRTLAIPAEATGRCLWLEFDGVFSNSHYWLNGREVGRQYSGYTRSRFDVTDAARCGEKNILTVQVDPRYDGWWYEGGGIYRHVRLIIVDPVHLAPDGVFVAPAVADPGNGVVAAAKVMASTAVTNSGSAAVAATVLSEILDAQDRIVATASSAREIASEADATITQELSLAEARLWSTDHPCLYRLRSTVSVADKIVDQVTTTFGVRQVRFDAERGFFLNGRPLKLRGVNMHQDHAGVGIAVPDRLFTWRLEQLKKAGCNAIRMSHNPVEPFLLDECDRLGFLVVAENRHLGDTTLDQSPKETPAIEHRDLSAMVRCDRNHPSIILWSLCNEQWIQGTPEAAKMIRAMKQRVHELDPTRLVTAAMNGGFDSVSGMASELDVIGINYHPEVYDRVHRLFPHTPIIATEIASEVGTRGIYATGRWDGYQGDRERGYVSAYSVNAGPGGQTVENAWPPVASRDFIGGGFVWAGFDYKGEPRPFEWPCINSHYGLMDICGFPKDSYYYYQAWWTETPVLHVFPHWNWPGHEGQPISVWVHSNCDEVELFLNGRSLGRKKVKKYMHLEWSVPYSPGTLLARGYRRGGLVKTAKIETTGSPAALVLAPDRTTIKADGADVAVFTVAARDTLGRLVPVAQNRIHFSVTGPGRIIGVGNGDPSSHESDKASERCLFNGLAQVIVQSTPETGSIELTATAEALAPAAATVQSRPRALLAHPCGSQPRSDISGSRELRCFR